ncbi:MULTISPECIES: multidrug effflux MFS transporter [Staphylococcus]|uniref:Bcr/CflA family efflux transporter n=2 Tax=Staphylococcus equorum TaxID=246432 RepID=A0AAP7LU80_9STAP|nr:multidrug effflux MFS transporter [Staphylococcus equorum]ANR68839.1 bicyclomycin transporter TcaB [Staphylococcus equorum]ERH36327.1 bicyclomycin transporter TcaB [Staphylococcus equorum UMC-CNS-924]KKI53199.1 Teicoplanin resistance associated membrane protein TcaB [Staphylococcus equorum subsp. equorum]MCE5007365.1 multidrug effflux MFS transporter [Staphylococcus equorum]MCE5046706.1 multidrug effflux MFS transporter [Staphylococcus equorum]
MSNYQEQHKNSLLFVIILGALTAIGALSIDMFLPGLPQIQSDFNTTTSNSQLTLSLFMIGLALGNLFVGPISDSIGRKTPLIVAMALFTLASIGIIFVDNIWLMIALRFVQGFCGGAGAVISRAISSDLYTGKQLTKFLALLMLVNGVAPVLAPALGGVILSFSTWRMVFVILTIFGLLMLFGTIFNIKESLSTEQRDSPHLVSIFKGFKQLLATPRFVLPMLIQGVTFVILFSYISASPFIAQRIYDMSAQQFSLMFASVGISLIVSSQLTGKLVDYIDRQVLLRVLTIIQLVGVVWISVILYMHLSIWLLFIGFIVLVAPVTGVATLGFSIAMDENTVGNGSASSLLGLVQFLIGGLVSPLVGVMGEDSYIPYVTIILIVGLLLITLQIINYYVFKRVAPK